MKSKYNMTRDDNVFFAKRKLVDIIYQSAVLEGIKATLGDVYVFMNNVNTGKISVDDMLKLKGLKDAWSFVMNSLDDELTIDYIKKVHFEVCKGQNIFPLGDFRDKGVGITGTSWRPKLPSECDYVKELDDLKKIEEPLERAISIFCWIQRSQMFLNGNKRVANIVANKELIRTGQGIISIPVEKIAKYLGYLINYYETNDNTKLKNWLYDNAIDGI